MKKLFKDIGLVGITDFARTLKILILMPLLTAYLGTKGYGILSQITVTIMFLMAFQVLGLDSAIIRFLAGEKDKDVIRNNFLSSTMCIFFVSLVFSFVFYLFSKPLAFYIMGDENLSYLIKIVSVLLVLYPIDYMMVIYFRAFQRMVDYFIFSTSEVITEVLFITFSVLRGYGIIGVLLTLVFCKLIFLIAKTVRVASRIGLSFPKHDRLRPFILFGFPLVLVNSFFLLINYGDRYIVRFFLGIDKVGIYSVGYALGMFIIAIMRPFEYVLYPKIAAYWNNNEMEKVKSYIKKTLSLSVPIAVLTCLLMIIFAKQIVGMVSNEAFISAVPTVPYLTLGFLIFGIGIIGERIITLLNKTKMLLYIYSSLAVFNIFLNILLVPRLGIQGAALATFMTFTLYSLITLGIAHRYIV